MIRTLISLVLLSTVAFVKAQIEVPARLKDRPELIIKHCGYTLSYNCTRGTPNWSAWMLTKSHLFGHEPRSPQFYPDPLVPIAYRVQPSDYTGTGYDRGHMCPAADMAWSTSAMHDSFYMSNTCPQTPTLNRYYWKQLETACRKWAVTEDTLYIVCGPVYKGTCTRVKGRVSVPSGFFKVVLSLRRNHAKAIGFYYSNSAVKQSIQATATTVDEIERLTGIDFFYTLPDSIETVVEGRFNLSDWR